MWVFIWGGRKEDNGSTWLMHTIICLFLIVCEGTAFQNRVNFSCFIPLHKQMNKITKVLFDRTQKHNRRYIEDHNPNDGLYIIFFPQLERVRKVSLIFSACMDGVRMVEWLVPAMWTDLKGLEKKLSTLSHLPPAAVFERHVLPKRLEKARVTCMCVCRETGLHLVDCENIAQEGYTFVEIEYFKFCCIGGVALLKDLKGCRQTCSSWDCLEKEACSDLTLKQIH